MIYFFSGSPAHQKLLKPAGAKNFLFSYFTEPNYPLRYANPEGKTIIDSGAFSAWNSGAKLNIEDYKNYCMKLPIEWTFVNMDTIPETGSGQKEIERCAYASLDNYLYLKKHLKNVLPVYHYGENFSWMYAYQRHTDYIGVSPANDIKEQVKRTWLKWVFGQFDYRKIRTHAFGYSSFVGMTLFPFYSVDSISYKRIYMYYPQEECYVPFYASSKTEFLAIRRINKYIEAEQLITQLWKSRGIEWNI